MQLVVSGPDSLLRIEELRVPGSVDFPASRIEASLVDITPLDELVVSLSGAGGTVARAVMIAVRGATTGTTPAFGRLKEAALGTDSAHLCAEDAHVTEAARFMKGPFELLISSEFKGVAPDVAAQLLANHTVSAADAVTFQMSDGLPLATDKLVINRVPDVSVNSERARVALVLGELLSIEGPGDLRTLIERFEQD